MDDDAAHLEWLKAKCIEYESDLAKAQKTVARIQPIVASLRAAIQALSNVQKDLTTEPVFSPLIPMPPGHTLPTAPLGIEKMKPQRFPRFTAITLMDALANIMVRTTLPMHADEITKLIYDCKTGRQFQRAKSTVVAELYRGIKEERALWRALGANKFIHDPALANKENNGGAAQSTDRASVVTAMLNSR